MTPSAKSPDRPGLEKRSISIAGHRTSIALEPQFWDALESMAKQDGQSIAGLIRSIDEGRTSANLSSAARLAVLAWYQDQLRTVSATVD